MDLGKFDVKAAADKGADLHLKHPSSGDPLFASDGTPFTVRVVGKDSAIVRDASKATNQARVDGSMTDQQAGLSVMGAAIIGWHDEMEMDGKRLPYSPAAALELVTNPKTDWIAEQVGPFSLRRANFLQNMQDD